MSRRILVFGAGGNLGIEAAKAFSDSGFGKLLLFERHPEKLSQFPNAEIIKVNNLTDEGQVKIIFDAIGVNRQGEDFLFSTIGGFYGGKEIKETSLADWERMFDLNLKANFLLAKYFIRNLESARGGSLMFTSALSAFSREGGKSAYTISKAALNNLTEALAEEGKGKNFTANALAPFILDTPENREWIEDASLLVAPSAIAKLILTLFENYRIISGNVIKLPSTVKY